MVRRPRQRGIVGKVQPCRCGSVLSAKTGALVGKNFVITGSLEAMSRDVAAEKIRAQGGGFQSSVAKDTTYLVAGGKVGESKLKKAQSYGTQVIDEVAFLALIGEK